MDTLTRETAGSSASTPSPAWMDRKIDLDSHEMIPMEMWGEAFGDVGALYNQLQMRTLIELSGANSLSRQDVQGDVEEISYDSVWRKKGPSAPSSIDLTRRPAVLDFMGIERQLVYPTFALVALLMAYDPKAHEFLRFDPTGLDTIQLGRDGCAAHNKWAASITRKTDQRVRPVGIVLTDDVDGMIRQAQQMADDGVRAFLLPAGTPPAGTSPADRALAPFWSICEERKIPVTFHLGTEFTFLASMKWSANAPEFEPSSKSTVEFQIEPYRTATFHFCMENFLTAMVLGGVFERHPNLSVGVIETSAHWVGPLARRLDIVAGEFEKRLAETLTMAPSRYLARQLRVAPFPFEPIDDYLKTYPDMADVYSFATDFPHVEGGVEAQKTFARKLEGFGDDIHEKFFRTNGLLLTPD